LLVVKPWSARVLASPRSLQFEVGHPPLLARILKYLVQRRLLHLKCLGRRGQFCVVSCPALRSSSLRIIGDELFAGTRRPVLDPPLPIALGKTPTDLC